MNQIQDEVLYLKEPGPIFVGENVVRNHILTLTTLRLLYY